jgi:hypothetical protein
MVMHKTDKKEEISLTNSPNDMPQTGVKKGPIPPPPREYPVEFKYWIRERVEVTELFTQGVVVALAVNQTENNVYLVDFGGYEKWYAESMIEHIDTKYPPIPPATYRDEDSKAKTDKSITYKGG